MSGKFPNPVHLRQGALLRRLRNQSLQLQHRSNDPTEVGGQLNRNQVISSNFNLAGQTGWAIMQNGDAYFFNIVAQGTITASQFIGTDFIINSAGSFFYAGTPATGNLAFSITAASGTDGFGNSYVEGFAAYGTGASAGKIITLQVSAGNPTLFFLSGKTEEDHPAQQSLQIDNIGLPNELLNLFIIGPSVNASPDQTYINLQSAPANASGSAGGNLVYTDISAVSHALLQWGSGGIFAVNIKDSANYDIQRRTRFATGQNVSAAGFTALSGITSLSAGAQTYRINCKLMLECIANSSAVVSFTGPTLSSLEVDWTIFPVANSSSTSVSPFTWRTVNTLNGITAPAMTAAQNWTIYMEGQITFSAAGSNFGLEVAASGGTGNYDVIAGSYMDIMPVTV